MKWTEIVDSNVSILVQSEESTVLKYTWERVNMNELIIFKEPNCIFSPFFSYFVSASVLLNNFNDNYDSRLWK